MSSTSSVAIVSGEAARGYCLPLGFSANAIPELLELEVHRGSAADRVEARFSTLEAASRRQPELERALGLRQTAVLSVSQRVARRGALWPETLLGQLERVAAVAGLALGLVTYWSTFFGRPAIQVQLIPAIDVVSGEVAESRLRAINRTDGETTVEFSSDYPVQFEPMSVVLKPREETSVVMRTASPVVTTVQFSVRSDAKRGLLIPRAETQTLSALEVWPREPAQATAGKRIYRAGRAAEMTVPLLVGHAAPSGLNCEALLVRRPGVKIVGAQPVREMKEPLTNSEKGNELSMLSWVAPPVDAYSRSTAQVFLESAVALSDEDWNMAKPTVRCSGRR